MKIRLSCPVHDLHRMDRNLQTLLHEMEAGQRDQVDLLLTGESFLSGFDALSFDYREDLARCLYLRSETLTLIRNACRSCQIAVGFGAYIQEKGGIYSAYIVLDKEGEIADLYKRVSPGWKEAKACADYREGRTLHSFRLEKREFATMLCGDFWDGEVSEAIASLDGRVDAFFWPCHCDFDPAAWTSDNRDYQDPGNISSLAYAHQSAIAARPVFFINNYCLEAERAKGGLYVWEKGSVLASRPMGISAHLDFELA